MVENQVCLERNGTKAGQDQIKTYRYSLTLPPFVPKMAFQKTAPPKLGAISSRVEVLSILKRQSAKSFQWPP